MAVTMAPTFTTRFTAGRIATPKHSRRHIVVRCSKEPSSASRSTNTRRETMLSATIVPALAGIFGPFPGKVPTDLGVQAGGGLKGCPETSNCLSSFAPKGDSHYTPPLSFDKSRDDAIADVSGIITNYPLDMGFDGGGASITRTSANLIYANFTSKTFGFVDDVEFLFEDGKMYVRSASRIGESDGGVNSKRVAYFTAELLKKSGWSA